MWETHQSRETIGGCDGGFVVDVIDRRENGEDQNQSSRETSGQQERWVGRSRGTHSTVTSAKETRAKSPMSRGERNVPLNV